MNRGLFTGLVIVLVFGGYLASAEDCVIVNGSFEDDGEIGNLALREPNGWSVELPAGKFSGYVVRGSPTEHRLTLESQWFVTFGAGDTGAVWQQLSLTGVDRIIFDLELETFNASAWDPTVCTPALLIDDEVVWEPPESSDIRGQYLDQVYTVEDKYRDDSEHKIALGLRINEPGMLFERYVAHWDSVDCNSLCGGVAPPAGDLDRDCDVDVNDLELLAMTWLAEIEPADRSNLFHGDDLAGYGMISLLDFAVYANSWNGDLADLDTFAEKWLDQVELEDEHNLFRADDIEPSGIINFGDFTVLADNWLGSSYQDEQ